MAFKRRAKIMLAVTVLALAALVVLTEVAFWLGVPIETRKYNFRP
jgi:hypothetical protein